MHKRTIRDPENDKSGVPQQYSSAHWAILTRKEYQSAADYLRVVHIFVSLLVIRLQPHNPAKPENLLPDALVRKNT